MSRNHSRLFTLACAFAIAGCSDNSPVADKAENAALLPAPQVVNSTDPSGAPPPANAASRQIDAGAAVSGTVSQIPRALRGRWGLNPEDCRGYEGDQRGMLEVTATGLRFYESVATPTSNVSAAPDRYSADFAFTGEGQSWTRFQSLEIQNGRLVRTESSPMASYTYAKCS